MRLAGRAIENARRLYGSGGFQCPHLGDALAPRMGGSSPPRSRSAWRLCREAAPLYGQSLAGALLKNTLPLYAACMVPGLAFVRFVPVLPGSSPGRGFSFVRLPYIT